MRAHVIDESGFIVNTILVDSLDFIPGLVDASLGGSIGDRFVDGGFVDYTPVVQVPPSITRRQGKIILSRYGLLENVENYLRTLEGQEGAEARLDFSEASEWRRDWPLLIAAAGFFGLSPAQIDQMFIEAAQI